MLSAHARAYDAAVHVAGGMQQAARITTNVHYNLIISFNTITNCHGVDVVCCRAYGLADGCLIVVTADA